MKKIVRPKRFEVNSFGDLRSIFHDQSFSFEQAYSLFLDYIISSGEEDVDRINSEVVTYVLRKNVRDYVYRHVDDSGEFIVFSEDVDDNIDSSKIISSYDKLNLNDQFLETVLSFDIDDDESIQFFIEKFGCFSNLKTLYVNCENISHYLLGELFELDLIDIGIKSLSIENYSGVNLMSFLYGMNVLEGLESLAVVTSNLIDHDLGLLAKLGMKSLKHLNCESNLISEEGVLRIVSAPWYENIIDLYLANNPIGSKGLDILFSSKKFRKIKRLDIRETLSEGYNLGSVLSCGNIASVEEISLEMMDLSNFPLPYTLSNLRVLDINDCFISMEDLVEIKKRSLLEIVLFSNINLNLDSIKYLLDKHFFEGLIHLSICPITTTAFNHLLSSPQVSSLEVFTVRWSNLGNEGLEILSRSEYMLNLKSLSLVSLEITDFNFIANASFLESLEYLYIYESTLSSENIEELETLAINNNFVLVYEDDN